ncbi:MAG: hypothetical protein ACREBU_16495, partial [Nitrososphaera sp.]
NLAVVDGCTTLKSILPNVKQSVISVSGTLFPNGCKMDETNASSFCGRNDIGEITIIITCPTGQFAGSTNTLKCSALYFKTPQASGGNIPCGPNDPFIQKDFATARDAVLNCIKSAVGNDYAGLGCTG